MAIRDGEYPCAMDRVEHVSLLVGKYIALLVAIRITDKILVCFSFISLECLLTNYAECSKRSVGSNDMVEYSLIESIHWIQDFFYTM